MSKEQAYIYQHKFTRAAMKTERASIKKYVCAKCYMIVVGANSPGEAFAAVEGKNVCIGSNPEIRTAVWL